MQLQIISLAAIAAAAAALPQAITRQVPDSKPSWIHPAADTSKCVAVKTDYAFYNGAPIELEDCKYTSGMQWTIQRGETRVRIAFSNYCLDATADPGNDTPLQLWECDDNRKSQDLYYTDDDRIAVYEQGSCVDLTDKSPDSGNLLQTTKCNNNASNQLFTVE